MFKLFKKKSDRTESTTADPATENPAPSPVQRIINYTDLGKNGTVEDVMAEWGKHTHSSHTELFTGALEAAEKESRTKNLQALATADPHIVTGALVWRAWLLTGPQLDLIINAVPEAQRTNAANYALRAAKSAEHINVLIKHGADIHQDDERILCRAIESHCTPLVKGLSEAGADFNQAAITLLADNDAYKKLPVLREYQTAFAPETLPATHNDKAFQQLLQTVQQLTQRVEQLEGTLAAGADNKKTAQHTPKP
ncbi:MAG: hypothetical protein OXT65_01375 [Alphaproteobacteria bacterium]|nr:hypothetical protein [Alphaproteobacteria bacterium]